MINLSQQSCLLSLICYKQILRNWGTWGTAAWIRINILLSGPLLNSKRSVPFVTHTLGEWWKTMMLQPSVCCLRGRLLRGSRERWRGNVEILKTWECHSEVVWDGKQRTYTREILLQVVELGRIGVSLLLKELLGWLLVSHMWTVNEKFVRAAEVATGSERLLRLSRKHRGGRLEMTQVPGWVSVSAG